MWYDRSEDPSGDTRVQHVDADGQVVAGWPLAGRRMLTPPIGDGPGMLAADGAGGVFAVWVDSQDGDPHVHLHHLQPDGTLCPGWPESGVRPKGGNSRQQDPVIASDGAGGVWVGWIDDGMVGAQVAPRSIDYVRLIQHITAGGRVDPALPAGGVAVGGFDVYADLGLVSDEAGGVFASWNGSDASQTHYGLFTQRLAPGGVPAAGWPASGLLYATTGFGFSARNVVADGQGGLLTAWNAYLPAVDRLETRAERVLADATTAPGWDPAGEPLGFAADYGGVPQPIADGDGGAIVVWADSSAGGYEVDLFAQHVRHDGTVLPIDGAGRLTVCSATGAQGAQQTTSDDAGGAFVIWVDQRADDGDVFLKRISRAELTTGVPPLAPTAGGLLRLAAPSPNPSNDRVEVALTLARASRVTAEILDPLGRHRRTVLESQRWNAGVHRLAWDGRDDSGRLVSPGAYLLVVRAGDARAAVRLLRVR
jgi:hypothetical protein